MLLIIIGLLICFYSLFRYKQAFILYILYTIFWSPTAFLFKVGGFSVIIRMVMSISFLIVFIINRKQYMHNKRPMPFAIPFLLILLSFLLSCFSSPGGFTFEFTRAISRYLQLYSTIWISWYIIDSEKDFNTLLKGIVIIFLIAAIYALIEYLFKANPYYTYKQSFSVDLLPQYSTTKRGYRIISVFDHSIGAGLTFALYAAFIIVCTTSNTYKLPYPVLAIIGAFIAIPCVLLSRARAAIILLVIASIPCIRIHKKRFLYVFIGLSLFIVLLLPFIVANKNLFLSFINPEAQKAVGGSSIEVRISQLDAVLSLVKDSPVFGLGEKFESIISNSYTEAAMGYESIWLEQLSKHGLFGIAVQIVEIFFSIYLIPKKYKSKEACFLGLAYWITYSVTTTLSFRLEIYYLFVFFFLKHSKINTRSCLIPK